METIAEASEKSDLLAEIQTEEQENFTLRRLEASDYAKGFLDLLGQLSVCGQVSQEEFTKRFEELQSLGDDHFVCVIEDLQSARIVATGAVFVERKFLRTCGKAGHIEDVVVDSSVRGKHLGHKIMNFLTQYAKNAGCYKVILDCSMENEGFYEKCGFKNTNIQMSLRF
ncbi:hypothetical protein SUGI_0423190 [Cryptomeria japonica]|uniref:glucosamine 6-phosphate N-acetyltransferase n=1 Tax=Cryptomeria japonica TaxID=3369 RepID=UPI002408BDB7|nr:glucosamine 6-phosphate N-acetyltransferase [Cryptomeria japonica]GLJ22475.1 hypothetical protein SUGI_0423190 [Cryptomeria japonica]